MNKNTKNVYDDKQKLHYTIELAKRNLTKVEVAKKLGYSKSMIGSALNGIQLKYPWPDVVRSKVDNFLIEFDKTHNNKQ